MADVFVSLGSNIDKEIHIPAGLRDLAAVWPIRAISSLYLCEAVGFNGPDFYNLVVQLETDMTIDECIAQFKQIEIANGRPAIPVKNTPRTLDIDLLLYDDNIRQQPTVLPRPEILSCAFVLWPLAEIAGHRRHPVTLKTFSEHWHAFDGGQHRITQQPLPWKLT